MPLWRGQFKVRKEKKESKSRPGKKKIIWLVVVLSLFLTAGLVRAGSLTPSGSPASTMHTLQEIYDSLAGTFDSTNTTATSTGSLVQILRYISNNFAWVSVGTDSSSTAGRVFESTTILSSGNLNITTGVLQLASTTRIDNLGQATLTTSSISVLTVNTSSSLAAITFTSATGTNLVLSGVASSSNFQSGGLQFGNATGTNAFFSGVASSTNFQAGGLQFNNATGTNAFFSGVASSTAFQTGALQFNNATGTNLKATLGLFTTASSTNFQAGNIQFQDATGTNLKAGLALFTTASSTNFQAGNIQFQDATGTNIKITTGLFTTASSTNFQAGNIQFQDATGTNIKITTGLFTTASSTNFQAGGLQFGNATGTNILALGTVSSTNAFNTNSTSSVLTLSASGTPALIITGIPQVTSTRALVQFGGYNIVGGNATGTFIGLNTPVFAGDFINFQIASTTNFSINNLGGFYAAASSTIVGLNFTNSTGTTLFSTTASSTNFQANNIQFANATGTNAVFSGVASSTNFQTGGLQFNNATGTNAFFSGVASSTNFQAGGLQFGNATGTNAFFSGVASSTNFQSGGLQFGNATGTNAFFSGVASSTAFQTGALQFNNATGTNLTISLITSNAALTIGNINATTTFQASTTVFSTGGVERLRITTSGFIGIGTTTPAYKFVLGDRTNQFDLSIPKGAICVDDATGAGCPAAPVAGTVYASTTAISAIDLAENYPTLDSLEPGDIAAFDIANEENVVKATVDNANQIMGIVSTQPGVLLGRKIENSKAIALSGRVPVKVSDEGGAVKIGDPIILSSSTPGVGMKGTNGRIVGYALQNWSSGNGLGKIDVFVKLQPAPTEPTVLDQITTSLKQLGLEIKNGILKVTTLIADLIQTKRVETDTLSANQLEMKDVDTGQIYCVQIKSGEWVKTPGVCGSSNPTAVQTMTPPPPASAPSATTTVSTDSGTAATSTNVSAPTTDATGTATTSDATTTP